MTDASLNDSDATWHSQPCRSNPGGSETRPVPHASHPRTRSSRRVAVTEIAEPLATVPAAVAAALNPADPRAGSSNAPPPSVPPSPTILSDDSTVSSEGGQAGGTSRHPTIVRPGDPGFLAACASAVPSPPQSGAAPSTGRNAGQKPAAAKFRCVCGAMLVGRQGHKCPMARAPTAPAPPAPIAGVNVAMRPWPLNSLSGMSYDSIFCCPLTTGDVPVQQIALYSAVVSELIDRIIAGEENAWKAFFLLPRLVFALPRGGRGMAQQIRNNLVLFHAGEWEALLARRFQVMRGTDRSACSKDKRAVALARAGHMSGALRALGDGVQCDTTDPSVYSALCELHPPPEQPVPVGMLAPSCPFSEEQFCKVVSSLAPRRAPDAAGWRGEYFKRLTSVARLKLFQLAQQVLQRPTMIPQGLRPFLFGARLIAIPKSHGGIRPIAIGTILRKLISAVFALTISDQLPAFFAPLQYGVGVPGGAEDVLTALRIMHEMKGKRTVAEVDFTNAFNMVNRDTIAAEVGLHFPQLRTWFSLCYGQASHLLVLGQSPIRSARGVQQGDPLGPFLFALALQTVLKKVSSDSVYLAAYLDDVFLCGDSADVARVATNLNTEAAKIGLHCNVNKCWATQETNIAGNRLPVNAKPEVLGAPLNATNKLQTTLIPAGTMGKVSKLSDVQVAVHLLRYIHNTRLTFYIRTNSPSGSERVCRQMMAATRQALTTLLGMETIPDSSWNQCLLPLGPGMGLMDLPTMAAPMAAASVVEACAHLTVQDPEHFGDFYQMREWQKASDSSWAKPHFEAAFKAAEQMEGIDIQHAYKLQHSFAANIVSPALMEEFLTNPHTPITNKVIVQSAKNSPIARHFFLAIPSQKNLALSSAEMRVALRLFLSIPQAMNADNCACGKPLDISGAHALSCKRHGGLIYRHDNLKLLFAEMCKQARLSVEVEPHQASSGKKLRPDFKIHFGHKGQDIAFDLTIYNPNRDDVRETNSKRDGQEFLERVEKTKAKKYEQQCQELKVLFVPIVFSAYGGVAEASFVNGIEYIISKIPKNSFVSPNWAAPNRKSYWLQRIAITLWAGNVRKVAPFLRKGAL